LSQVVKTVGPLVKKNTLYLSIYPKTKTDKGQRTKRIVKYFSGKTPVRPEKLFTKRELLV